MSNRIFVATRKGLFILKRKAGKQAAWSIEATEFLGDPVSMVLPDRRNNYIYAALNLGHFGTKLQRSQDGGHNWQECNTPKYPEQTDSQDGESQPGASLEQIWSLESGGSDRPGTLWAGTLPGGLFVSHDHGDSWELNTSLWNREERQQWAGGGYDSPGIHSICIDPRDSRRITLAVSIGGVWLSEDAGETWHCRAQGMRAAYMPSERQYDPLVQDPHRMVQCASNPDILWVQHHNGIFRSTDGATNWQEITDVAPSTFGFAAAVHPQHANTAWFVPAVKDECRVPVDGHMVVTRTRDGGNSFEVLSQGLPQQHAYDLVYRHGLDIDETGECLVMGSTSGGLWISENQGDQWHCISEHLPPIYCVRFG